MVMLCYYAYVVLPMVMLCYYGYVVLLWLCCVTLCYYGYVVLLWLCCVTMVMLCNYGLCCVTMVMLCYYDYIVLLWLCCVTMVMLCLLDRVLQVIMGLLVPREQTDKTEPMEVLDQEESRYIHMHFPFSRVSIVAGIYLATEMLKILVSRRNLHK